MCAELVVSEQTGIGGGAFDPFDEVVRAVGNQCDRSRGAAFNAEDEVFAVVQPLHGPEYSPSEALFASRVGVY